MMSQKENPNRICVKLKKTLLESRHRSYFKRISIEVLVWDVGINSTSLRDKEVNNNYWLAEKDGLFKMNREGSM